VTQQERAALSGISISDGDLGVFASSEAARQAILSAARGR